MLVIESLKETVHERLSKRSRDGWWGWSTRTDGFSCFKSGKALAGCPLAPCMVSGGLRSFSGTSSAASAAPGKIKVFVLDVLNFVSFPRCAASSWASRPLLVLLSAWNLMLPVCPCKSRSAILRGSLRRQELPYWALPLESHVSLPPTLGLLEGQGCLACIYERQRMDPGNSVNLTNKSHNTFTILLFSWERMWPLSLLLIFLQFAMFLCLDILTKLTIIIMPQALPQMRRLPR